MLDIDKINEELIEIKIFGDLVCVKQPTFDFCTNIAEEAGEIKRKVSMAMDESEELAAEKSQNDFMIKSIVDLINNNTSAKKFTANQIKKKLSPKAIRKLFEALQNSIVGIVESPN